MIPRAGFSRVSGRPRVIGHRGVRIAGDPPLDPPSRRVPPENTLAAFAAAVDEGAEAIELDVRLSASGELVVLHDPTLEHVTGGADTRAAAALSSRQLASVPLAGGARVPLLTEALAFARARRLPVNVELKRDVPSRPAVVRAAARVLGSWDPAHAVLVSSFDPLMLTGLALLAPAVPRALLIHPEQWRRTALALFHHAGSHAVHLEHTLATPARLARFQRAGLLVNAWTVNDPAEAMALAEAGVDGLITDRPAAIRAALEQR